MRRHHHPGLMMVNLQELNTVANILREEKMFKAADVVDAALREIIELRNAQPEPPANQQPFNAPVRH